MKSPIRAYQDYYLYNGLILKRSPNLNERDKIMIPKNMAHIFIQHYHNQGGHPSVERTATMIRARYHIQDLKSLLTQHIRSCTFCIGYKQERALSRGLLQHIQANCKMQILSLEGNGGFLVNNTQLRKYAIVAIDVYSRFVFGKLVDHLNTQTKIRK